MLITTLTETILGKNHGTFGVQELRKTRSGKKEEELRQIYVKGRLLLTSRWLSSVFTSTAAPARLRPWYPLPGGVYTAFSPYRCGLPTNPFLTNSDFQKSISTSVGLL